MDHGASPSPHPTPSVDESWDRIEAWLAEHAPVTYGTLRPPAREEDVEAAQRELGVAFHPDLIASLRRHDGTARRDDRRNAEDVLEMPRPYGPLAGLDDLVHGTLFLRSFGADPAEDFGADPAEDFGADPAEDFAHDGSDREEDAGWRRAWLPITLGIGRDTRGGLFLSCREGARYGALGRYSDEEPPSFTPWTSLRRFLAALADSLETRRPIDGAVPVAFDGRLLWEDVPEPLVEPRSALAEAERHAEPEPPVREYTAEVPRPGPDGGRAIAFFLRRITAPTPPDRPDVVFVEHLEPAEVLRRVGVVPHTLRDRSRARARAAGESAWAAFRPMVRAGALGTWSCLLDETGEPQGRRPEVLRRLSTGTRAVALWRQGRGEVHLAAYEDGRPVRTERLHRRPSPSRPGRPHRAVLSSSLPPEEDEPHGPYEEMLDLVRETWGIDFHPGETDLGVLPGGLVLPLLDDLPQPAPYSTVHHLDLGPAVERADEATLRAAVAAQLRRLAAETGIDAHPEIADALRLVDAGRPPTVTDDDPLGVRLRTLNAEAHAAHRSLVGHDRWTRPGFRPAITEKDRRAWTSRARAGRALRLFLEQPPHVAGAAVLEQRTSPDWRAEFLHDLDHARGARAVDG
ncbi:hypothetical protein [Streptomyces macrosporus]